MSARTRQHRPTHASPRLSRRWGLVVERGDGSVYRQDTVRWPASLGTFRHRDQQPTSSLGVSPDPTNPPVGRDTRDRRRSPVSGRRGGPDAQASAKARQDQRDADRREAAGLPREQVEADDAPRYPDEGDFR